MPLNRLHPVPSVIDLPSTLTPSATDGLDPLDNHQSGMTSAALRNAAALAHDTPVLKQRAQKSSHLTVPSGQDGGERAKVKFTLADHSDLPIPITQPGEFGGEVGPDEKVAQRAAATVSVEEREKQASDATANADVQHSHGDTDDVKHYDADGTSSPRSLFQIQSSHMSSPSLTLISCAFQC